MFDAKSCLQKAEQLERLAEDMDEDSSKTTLLEIAQRWRRMAADPAFQNLAATHGD